jgi:endoglucanase
MAEQYVCAYVNGGVQTTPDGLAWVRQWAPLQYSNNAAFVTAVYSDYLAEAGQSLTCGGKTFTPDQVGKYVRFSNRLWLW